MSTNLKEFMSHNPTNLNGANQFECPLTGDDSGIVIVIGDTAWQTDCYEVLSHDEYSDVAECIAKGFYSKWEA